MLLIEKGLELLDVYEVLEFNEDYYMRSVINQEVKMRVEAKMKGQISLSNTVKKCMNSLYGKTCENL